MNVKSLTRFARLVGGGVGLEPCPSGPGACALCCCPVPCPVPSQGPPTMGLSSSLPPYSPLRLPPHLCLPRQGCPSSPGSTVPVSLTSTELEDILPHSACCTRPAAALPALGPFWLVTSCCRETLSSIFLTTRWSPLPPLNKLHGSNGWSTAGACMGRVGN